MRKEFILVIGVLGMSMESVWPRLKLNKLFDLRQSLLMTFLDMFDGDKPKGKGGKISKEHSSTMWGISNHTIYIESIELLHRLESDRV